MSTDAFRTQLLASLLSTLPGGLSEDDVTLTIDTSARTVSVTVEHLQEAGTTAAAVSTSVQAASFTSTLASSIGAEAVELTARPTIEYKVTPVPSPPPATPPPPPLPTSGSFSLNQNQEQSTSGESAALSNTQLWVIIIGVIFVLLLGGCMGAYYRGKRSGKKKAIEVQAAQAQPKTDANAAAAAASSSSSRPETPPSPRGSGVGGMPDNAMQLIGLGVALERQLSGSRTTAAAAPPLTLTNAQLAYPQPFSQPVPPNELEAALQNVQAATANLQAVRTSQSMWLSDAMAAASAHSSPRSATTPHESAVGTPKGAASGSADHV